MSLDEVLLRPVVAIPAKNEAERLPKLLAALASQTWLTMTDCPLDVVVVLNNCDDHSADVMTASARRHAALCLDVLDVQLPPDRAHVGSARRLAMERARDIGGPRGILFSTDADAVPAADWIEASLRAIHAGADLVGGQIIGDKSEEAILGPGFVRRASRHLQYAKLVDRLSSLIDPIHHDPWPRHSDHTGASLAIRGDTYTTIGGMPALPFREDIGLVSKAIAAGYRLRHSLDVRVGVSARLDGRARGGMADALKAWVAAESLGLPHLVEDPESVHLRLIHRRRKRVAHRTRDPRSRLFSMPSIDLSPDFGSTGVPSPFRKIEIDTAIECMRQIVQGAKDPIHVS
jgi:hypothetical protein